MNNNNAKLFWNFFTANIDKYLTLDSLNQQDRDLLLDDLLASLQQFSKGLFFQIAVGHESNELVISADGNKDYFDSVETIVDAAPKIHGWKIIAFKPRQDLDFQIKYESVKINPKDVWFLPLQNKKTPDKLGLRLFFKNFSKKKESLFLEASFQILDTILGEKDCALYVQHVEVDKLPIDPDNNGLMPLIDLPAYLDWKNAKKN